MFQAGLVALFRKLSNQARADFADEWADAQSSGERPDLEPITVELTVERIEEAADAIEALSAEVEALTNNGETMLGLLHKATARECGVRAEAWVAAVETMRANAKTSLSAAWAADLIDIWCTSITTPADISAALDRVKAEAHAAGMREAAKLCAAAVQETKPGNATEAVIFHLGFTEGRKVCERAILAAIPLATTAVDDGAAGETDSNEVTK